MKPPPPSHLKIQISLAFLSSVPCKKGNWSSLLNPEDLKLRTCGFESLLNSALVNKAANSKPTGIFFSGIKDFQAC